MSFKKIFQDSKKVKRIRNNVSKYQNKIYICISWYSKVCWYSKKLLVSAELKEYVTWFIYIFFDLLYVRHKFAKIHHCRIWVTDFREGVGLFGLPSPLSPHPWASPKRPILYRVKPSIALFLVYCFYRKGHKVQFKETLYRMKPFQKTIFSKVFSKKKSFFREINFGINLCGFIGFLGKSTKATHRDIFLFFFNYKYVCTNIFFQQCSLPWF